MNFPTKGPGIFESGPVKAVIKIIQNRRNNSTNMAVNIKVVTLYMLRCFLKLEVL